MSCEDFRETVLEVATDADERRRIAEALAHVETCNACHDAIADFDQIVGPLQPAAGSEPDQGWEAFDQRMESLTAGFRGRKTLHWGGPVLGFAAASLIAASLFWFGNRSAQLQHPLLNLVAANLSRPIPLDSSSLEHDTTAFARVSQVFEGRAGWMLVSDSAATRSSKDLFIADESVSGDRWVDVLRLTMLRQGRIVSTADLVIVPGQAADLTLTLPTGVRVRYRAGTSAETDGRLSLLAEIKPASGDHPIASLASALDMQPNKQLNVGELQTAFGRYELCSALSRTKLPAE